MVTVDDVRRLALALPGAYEQPTYGGLPSWRTRPRAFASLRDVPERLSVFVPSLEEKEALLAADPRVFSTIPHHDGHPLVLVDLAAASLDEIEELLTDAWRSRAPRRSVAAWEAEHPEHT